MADGTSGSVMSHKSVASSVKASEGAVCRLCRVHGRLGIWLQCPGLGLQGHMPRPRSCRLLLISFAELGPPLIGLHTCAKNAFFSD